MKVSIRRPAWLPRRDGRWPQALSRPSVMGIANEDVNTMHSPKCPGRVYSSRGCWVWGAGRWTIASAMLECRHLNLSDRELMLYGQRSIGNCIASRQWRSRFNARDPRVSRLESDVIRTMQYTSTDYSMIVIFVRNVVKRE